MVMGISSPSYKLKFLRPRQLEPLSLTPPSSSFRALELKEKVQPLIPWPVSPFTNLNPTNSLSYALQDGKIRLEIDFPSVRNTLDFDFEDDNEGRWQSTEPPSLYIFINCSTRELAYIEKYVVMLKQADGSYACIAESANCFSLGEAKEELLRVLGLQEEEGSSLEFLRRGYKASTWWEEDFDSEVSYGWRS
ncbi:hypothetical protein JHK85_017767 [Glycine max]|nr:hypothetical protein JHK85_017767 [Glycine max]